VTVCMLPLCHTGELENTVSMPGAMLHPAHIVRSAGWGVLAKVGRVWYG